MLKSILTHDFRFAMLNQAWRLISGPLLLILIPFFLTGQEQGYWFTFIALAALVLFADMGFSTILLQFSAHEFAYLNFTKEKTLQGDEFHLERIVALFFFSLKWAGVMALAVLPLILVIGYCVFNKKSEDVNWLGPWLVYGTASFFVFFNSVILAFIEGCNGVGDAQKIRFSTSVVTTVTCLVSLVSDFGLYALACSLFVGSAFGSVVIFFSYKNLLHQLLSLRIFSERVEWWPEIKPLLWRYAISWASGYFMMSIFTPIAFEYYGSVVAGRVGLSLAVITSIFSIANVWMVVITPKINILVAQDKIDELNRAFKFGFLASVCTYFFGVLMLMLIVSILQQEIPALQKLAIPLVLLGFAIAWLCQLIVNNLAIYMRAYKKEPLMFVSCCLGIYITISTVLIARNMSSDFLFLGFVSSYVWGIPWVVYIFKKNLKKVR